MVVGFMTFGISNLFAQEEQAQPEEAATEQVAETVAPAEEVATTDLTPAEVPTTFREVIKKQFIDGGPGFMGIVLVILLLGMAISIERIIYLTMADANSTKLLAGIEEKMKAGDVEGAKQLCKEVQQDLDPHRLYPTHRHRLGNRLRCHPALLEWFVLVASRCRFAVVSSDQYWLCLNLHHHAEGVESGDEVL